MLFMNRSDAGRRLAVTLRAYHRRENAIVVGFEGGGMTVGRMVSRLLGLPMHPVSANPVMDTGEDLRGKTVILVDDGMTPASKLIAGAAAVRLRGAAELVFAVPVFSLACRRLRGIVEEIAVIDDPEVSFGVGQLYGDCLGKSGEVSSYSA